MSVRACNRTQRSHAAELGVTARKSRKEILGIKITKIHSAT
jgi:hypothetical protein